MFETRASSLKMTLKSIDAPTAHSKSLMVSSVQFDGCDNQLLTCGRFLPIFSAIIDWVMPFSSDAFSSAEITEE
jgi:hypothetical protein